MDEKKEYKARKKAYNKARRKAIRPWKGLTIFSALVAIIIQWQYLWEELSGI